MKLNKSDIKLVQVILNNMFRLRLAEDGIAGSKTVTAILMNIKEISSNWNVERQLVGTIQWACNNLGFDAGPIDGYFGDLTYCACEELIQYITTGKKYQPWRDEEGTGGKPLLNTWPLQTQTELEKFYGPVGTHQVNVISPYPLKIAWAPDKIITHFSCHSKIADPVRLIMEEVLDEYGLNQIQDLGLDMFGGCLNVRKMRGGTKWSTHSWGISIDWDPARNRLKWGKDKANFANPVYNKWWEIWERHGAVSLGRTKGYDYMHVQFAKVN